MNNEEFFIRFTKEINNLSDFSLSKEVLLPIVMRDLELLQVGLLDVDRTIFFVINVPEDSFVNIVVFFNNLKFETFIMWNLT